MGIIHNKKYITPMYLHTKLNAPIMSCDHVVHLGAAVDIYHAQPKYRNDN
jgi:hypothetical protein